MLLYRCIITVNKSTAQLFCLSFFLHLPPLTVDQTTDIVLYSADKYTKPVLNQEFGYVDGKLKDLRVPQQISSISHTAGCVHEWVCLCFILRRETVEPSSTYENTLTITPMLAENKEKRGLALDGRLKDEDTNLASTTM